MGSLTVLRPGMLTTVQDAGRWGYQHVGVSVAGPMDWYSHWLANARAGNPPGAAALEITLIGPELIAHGDVTVAVAGAVFDLTVEGRPVGPDEAFGLRTGERLRFGTRQSGARCYLAASGGFAVEEVMGSRSTSVTTRVGPLGGRPLRTGDELPVGSQAGPPGGGLPLEMPHGLARVRVIPGPHDGRFTADVRQALFSGQFAITPESNRMGYRLDGPRLPWATPEEVLSDASPIGSIQVPPSGSPILLMADRQTTGGYPRIATVITADLPLAGQLAPGDTISFAACTPAEAVAALGKREADLQGRRP